MKDPTSKTKKKGGNTEAQPNTTKKVLPSKSVKIKANDQAGKAEGPKTNKLEPGTNVNQE